MDRQTLSVSEFLDVVNMLLSTEDVSVYGEVTGAHLHPTGMYFSIKDAMAGGIMDCYMAPTQYRSAGVALEDGMLVRVGGVASVYKPKGRFSFRVQEIALAGEGSLKKAYEALKKKIGEEGLFERKRSLPEFISRIALVTSGTGAAIGDFRKNLLACGLHITHLNVRVEGAQAVPQVLKALRWLHGHADRFDVVVVVRGGGSLEDLQAFNDEQVVRALFGSPVPTVVSIGHERDVPLAQMVADAGASTPTGAAHVVNETWDRLRDVPRTAQRLAHAYASHLSSVRSDVDASAHRLSTLMVRVSGAAQRLGERLMHRLSDIGAHVASVRERIAGLERQLASADPARLLRLGYGIVTDEMGTVVRSVKDVRHGQRVRARIANGSFIAEVKELTSS